MIIIDLHPGRGEAKAAADSNVDFVCGDVTLRDTWEKALAVAKGYGRIDLVVNNAGIGHDPRVSPSLIFGLEMFDLLRADNLTAQPAHELDITLFDKLFNLNVKVRLHGDQHLQDIS